MKKRPSAATGAVGALKSRPAASVLTSAASALRQPGPAARSKLPAQDKPRRRCRFKQEERPNKRGRPAAADEDFLPIPVADVSADAPLRKVLYIMRGPPGCGKSTAARKLLAQHLVIQGVRWDPRGSAEAFSPLCRAFVFSTDDFFTEVGEMGDAEYKFKPKEISDNHKHNQTRCEMAMKLCLTPLFVDNTNISLWEMREYVQMADRFNYKTHIIDPRSLSIKALDPDVLEARCNAALASADGGGRAPGKDIPRHVLERMASNFVDLPDDGESPAALDAIRASKAPWEKTPLPPLPRYAGLDVEARALAALGAVELGPYFWEGRAQCVGDYEPSPGHHLFDARYWEGADAWRLPDRLHITVKFFRSREADSEERRAAEEFVGSWHPVLVTGLFCVRGGGILCAACELGAGEGAESLRTLAGECWVPHITLLSHRPWSAVDSTALLNAWAAADSTQSKSSAAEPAKATKMSTVVRETTGIATIAAAESLSRADTMDFAANSAESTQTAVESPEAPTLADTQTSSTTDPLEATKAKNPEAIGDDFKALTNPDKFELPGGGTCEVRRAVVVEGKEGTFDLCHIPLQPPLSLGSCQFKMFFK